MDFLSGLYDMSSIRGPHKAFFIGETNDLLYSHNTNLLQIFTLFTFTEVVGVLIIHAIISDTDFSTCHGSLIHNTYTHLYMYI